MIEKVIYVKNIEDFFDCQIYLNSIGYFFSKSEINNIYFNNENLFDYRLTESYFYFSNDSVFVFLHNDKGLTWNTFNHTSLEFFEWLDISRKLKLENLFKII